MGCHARVYVRFTSAETERDREEGEPWTTPIGCDDWLSMTRTCPRISVREDPTRVPSSTRRRLPWLALVAIGGDLPSYGAQADAAVNAGASATEIVDVLVSVVPVVGLPRVVAAAPKLAMALGYDTENAMEE